MSFKKLFSICILASLISCLGYSPTPYFTKLAEEQKCDNPPTQVDLYFEGESTNFSYTKIGIIEVKGGYTDKDDVVINSMKQEAIKRCCNAIIGIKKMYSTEQMGILFDSKNQEKYQAVVYYGIAVQKK